MLYTIYSILSERYIAINTTEAKNELSLNDQLALDSASNS